MRRDFRIGIDMGGTKIAGLALDTSGNELISRCIEAPRGSYEGTIEAIFQLVSDIERDIEGAANVGVGIPGSLSAKDGLVQNANSTWLNGRALDTDLSTRLERPVRIANDANCFALSEAIDGAGGGADTVFGVILGTGCGGGLVVNRALVDGPMGIGGEWGHNPLPWAEPGELPGPPCWCGRSGCIETWVSGPGMAADHERVTDEQLSAEAIAALATAGDGAARASLERHGDRLARALATLVNIIDPHVIVLGGGLSQMPHLYDELPKRIAPLVFASEPNVTIRRPRYGPASGVRGAAWLWGLPAR